MLRVRIPGYESPKISLHALFLLCAILAARPAMAAPRFVKTDGRQTGEAEQAVAVGEKYFYAVGTQALGQYDKASGKLVRRWTQPDSGRIIHLDSGVVAGDRLYCAHSNYPGLPMTSSVEVWDAEKLEHVESHSFGIRWGSCTWVDRHAGFWWATFAHYDRFRDSLGTDNSWTTLVKLDDQWRELEAWVLPAEILERMKPMSNSGGSWGPDSLLYLTGHDRPEVYRMRLPRSGSVLELLDILPLDIQGQGIAWDRANPGLLYAIERREKKVSVFRLEGTGRGGEGGH